MMLSERQILLMFVKQVFEVLEYFENRKKSNLNKTCCCRSQSVDKVQGKRPGFLLQIYCFC